MIKILCILSFHMLGCPKPTTVSQAQAIVTVPVPLQGQFLGVTGEDFVGQNCNTNPDGVKDWHIALQGIKNVPTRVIVTVPNNGGWWETPCNTIQNWIIRVNASPPNADLFFEPYQMTGFHVQIFYADGTTDETDIPAGPPNCTITRVPNGTCPDCVDLVIPRTCPIDQIFVNAAAGDFHLAPNSPAINQAECLAAVLTDKDGIVRPTPGRGCDVGAYQFVGASIPPSAPTGLTVKGVQ